MTFRILGIIIPTDFRIFFRGVETTNQTMLFDTHNIIIIESILLIILFGVIIHDDWKGLGWLETTSWINVNSLPLWHIKHLYPHGQITIVDG
jgi:hypothetical protein